MALGKHFTEKKPGDPTYSEKWSGVSYAPTSKMYRCEKCKGHVHNEGDSHYCPRCDDFVKVIPR